MATFLALEAYRAAENTRRRRQLKKRVADDVYGKDSAQSITDKSIAEIATPAAVFESHGEAPRSIARSLLDASYDEGLIREQLSRNYSFFGEEGMERVRKGRVVVVGCGGVGSWAAVMLVRS